MVFDEFFNHPFIRLTQSRPVPVSRRVGGGEGECSFSSSSPLQSPISYGSPPMACMVSNTGSPHRPDFDSRPSSSDDSEEQIEDFVLIPPLDKKSKDKATKPRPKSINVAKTKAANNPGTALEKSNSSELLETLTQLSYEQQPTPVPVPVASNKDAYEKMRKGGCPNTTLDSDDGDLVWTSANNSDTRSGAQEDEINLLESRSSGSVGSEGSNSSGNRFIADISQLSPPTVQFVIGTPPGCGSSLMSSNRRRSAPIVATNLPSSCLNSPIMRQLTPPRLHGMSCPSSDSPTATRLPAICSPDHYVDHRPMLTR